MPPRISTLGILPVIILVGCVQVPAPTPPARGLGATNLPETEPTPAEVSEVLSPRPTAQSSGALRDEEATLLMYRLSESDSAEAQMDLDRIIATDDTRFIAVLLELMRMNQIGQGSGAGYEALVAALQRLSGQTFGADWPAWIDWYGTTDLVPPPGFTGWKGKLLARIDPRFADFLRDQYPSRIRTEEIQWGGVRVDGIPALNNPAMVPASEESYMGAAEPVFGISLNGDSRAYPLRIMDWHEMANDVVGGVPVSLAYCTLCGSGIAYDGRGSDGVTYTFGSSGFLFRSNKLMYDRQTRSLWNQLTGDPVLGSLAGTGVKLNLLPVVVTTWEEWKTQHPDSLVLSLDTGYQRPYFPGAPYGDYFSNADTMFPVWQRSQTLPMKSRVYALNLDGVPKAYPVETLSQEQVVNDTLGSIPVVLIATRGVVTVKGISQRIGPVEYDAGAEVRAFDRGSETFSPGPDADTVLDSGGREWRVTEEALAGPEGQLAPRINGHLAYWFGWYAFFPQTLVYGDP